MTVTRDDAEPGGVCARAAILVRGLQRSLLRSAAPAVALPGEPDAPRVP